MTKKEDRKALKDFLDYDALLAIPIAERTQEQKNQLQRIYRRKRKREADEKAAINERMTRQEFWELHRASVSPSKEDGWYKRQEQVLDTVAWLDRLDAGTETPELCGENYLSAEEGLTDVLEDVRQNGVCQMGHVYASPEIPVDWIDGVFSGRPFYRDPEIFRLLCQEGEPTKIFCTYGYAVALPDFRVTEFLTSHCGWSVRDANLLVGRKSNGATDVFGKNVRVPSVVAPEGEQQLINPETGREFTQREQIRFINSAPYAGRNLLTQNGGIVAWKRARFEKIIRGELG